MKSKKVKKTTAGTKATTGRKKKPSTDAIVLTTLAVGAAGVIGYFGWQVYKKKRNKSSDLDKELFKTNPGNPTSPVHASNSPLPSSDTAYNPPPFMDSVRPKAKTVKSKATPKISNDDFPLKKGSKGENVRALQQALIDKHGKSILPKYGADSDFGTETANALKKAGYPASVSESLFNVIVQGSGSSGSSADKSSLGKKLYDAAVAKNFSSALSLLKQLKNQDDYQQTSEAFKRYPLRGVRQTLVNGMLNSFATNDQKQKIRLEFLRIGLKYDGSKWSLSGFDGKPIVTREPATVWVNGLHSLRVPAMMVLGQEVAQRLDYTLFENNRKFFLVQTKSVKYL
jgi:peptidoglycan hydrolase-like protein with peptidoglycan-binding domain